MKLISKLCFQSFETSLVGLKLLHSNFQKHPRQWVSYVESLVSLLTDNSLLWSRLRACGLSWSFKNHLFQLIELLIHVDSFDPVQPRHALERRDEDVSFFKGIRMISCPSKHHMLWVNILYNVLKTFHYQLCFVALVFLLLLLLLPLPLRRLLLLLTLLLLLRHFDALAGSFFADTWPKLYMNIEVDRLCRGHKAPQEQGRQQHDLPGNATSMQISVAQGKHNRAAGAAGGDSVSWSKARCKSANSTHLDHKNSMEKVGLTLKNARPCSAWSTDPPQRTQSSIRSSFWNFKEMS